MSMGSDGRMNAREAFNSLVRYAPLWAHLSAYVLTCLIAALFFCFGPRPVLASVEYFSGAVVPTHYSFEQKSVLLVLLFGAPVLLALGFVVATRIKILPGASMSVRAITANNLGGESPAWGPVLLFVASASVGIYDLLRVGAFAKLGAWSDYGSLVEGRWALFSYWGYFNFVNVYVILPVTAAWVILSVRGTDSKALGAKLIPLVVVIVLTLPLFQKRVMVTSLIIIFSAVLLHRVLSGAWTRRLTYLLLATGGGLVAVYFFLVVLPVYSETSRTAIEALIQHEVGDEGNHKPCEKEDSPEEMRRLCREVASLIGVERNTHIVAYTLLAPMTRTSLPAMYYPIVFPELHEYYGLDLGLDILGFGRMPDDNLVVWKYMYPNLPGGSAAAPYQFVLYSQVGMSWTLLLCVMVGVLLGGLWRGVLAGDISHVSRSLMGALLLLFSICLAIDSIRGSLLASYGVIWAWLFLTISFGLARLLTSRHGGLIKRFYRDNP